MDAVRPVSDRTLQLGIDRQPFQNPDQRFLSGRRVGLFSHDDVGPALTAHSLHVLVPAFPGEPDLKSNLADVILEALRLGACDLGGIADPTAISSTACAARPTCP